MIRHNQDIPHRGGDQQGGRPVTVQAQRKQTIIEFEEHYVWRAHQPLPQSRTTTLINVCAQGEQVVPQELDRASVAWSRREQHTDYADSRMAGQNPASRWNQAENQEHFLHDLLAWRPLGICGPQPGVRPGRNRASTGVRQSNRTSITRVILPPTVVRQTLVELPLREATMALVDAVTGLSASELVALKRKNVGCDSGILRSEFALVERELKETNGRDNPLPLAEPVLQVLRLWREHTPFRSYEDWICASPHYHGKTPCTGSGEITF